MMNAAPAAAQPPATQAVARHSILRTSFIENMNNLLSSIQKCGSGFDSITVRNQTFDEMSDIVVGFLVISLFSLFR